MKLKREMINVGITCHKRHIHHDKKATFSVAHLNEKTRKVTYNHNEKQSGIIKMPICMLMFNHSSDCPAQQISGHDPSLKTQPLHSPVPYKNILNYSNTQRGGKGENARLSQQ